ncbi:caspase-3-like [Littorina saxatilis]|uniref:Uncharacterized protein n=1 Tax=Littorina saxatilis TaxID=31220 RepID=A0AAN9G3K4_9CAEN
MDAEFKRILQRLHVDLVNNTGDVQSVIDGLFSEEVFNQRMKRTIESKPSDIVRMNELLRILSTRPNEAMYSFYKVLVDADEEPLAGCLHKALSEINRAPVSDGTSPAGQSSSAGASMPLGPTGDQPDGNNDDDELPPNWPVKGAYDPMRFEVTVVKDPSMKEIFEKAIKGGNNIQVYPMYRKRRGILLLLNNDRFLLARKNKVDLSDRTGTNQDQLALDRLFKELGFRVVIERDRTAQQMLDDIKKQGDQSHSDYDCFACAVLSHGFSGGFYGVDGKKVSLEEFKSAVDGKNCESLFGKPKIFIIQACQGDDLDGGATHDGPGAAGDTGLEKPLQNFKFHAEPDSKRGVKADFFTAMATVPEYVSWRVPGSDTQFSGSWFVQAVVYVIHKLAHKYDLHALMTRVNHLVSKAETKHGYKQVCEQRHTMGSHFYFFPGLTKDS